ncbi:hypothetical protein GCM10027169_38810 [Gordonia jinhuaensis]|uniref:Uncharacterized protein n=1 Tax=Gordonia jinhuaensis TaxID=1517702 RepID=A0A916WRX4_9ACTN|nr:hypothetical protein GCM10011489_10440 [Gordonia jinhuaensis]
MSDVDRSVIIGASYRECAPGSSDGACVPMGSHADGSDFAPRPRDVTVARPCRIPTGFRIRGPA